MFHVRLENRGGYGRKDSAIKAALLRQRLVLWTSLKQSLNFSSWCFSPLHLLQAKEPFKGQKQIKSHSNEENKPGSCGMQ